MFTGIITDIGKVVDVIDTDGRDLLIQSSYDPASVPLGASIAHSGVCLTVTEHTADGWRVHASPETLALTTVSRWRQGTRINLERSLRMGDELGGHLVFGHVDGLGTIRSIEPEGDGYRLTFSLPADLARMVAVKGSIAVDGISLTVNGVTDNSFHVTIIPHTWGHTTLGDRQSGDVVNLEADMLARYVARQLGQH
ncbi:MAG TPA: riboflavin synthase [Geminicoccus sp.]|uniref:riboflavin synthase n=1 Tax=Geminicoccus sp. TaxID=2024832 RepID=UPI002E37B909|nr:riboflavin synthase [Geminicoccus sp.]HEX2525490.1 riboflavin synthase [Geminicoccus sp.]